MVMLRNGDVPSNSCRTMAEALGVKRVSLDRFHRLPNLLCINWGFLNLAPSTNRVLNRDVSVSDKLTAFALLKKAGLSANVPDYTQDKAVANKWLAKDKVLARSTSTGSGGAGITVVRKGGTMPDAKFYVKYIRKQYEYRMHVVNGKVIFTQQKRRKSDVEQTGDQALIRNHANGWVFAENKVEFASNKVKESAEDLAIKSVAALGLDFAAIDLIVEDGTNNVFFLEANTRPGLESSRLIEEYTKAFRGYLTATNK
jgi:glutathione synthase/RimK-type ligase-like ATP-grasp enzyme